MRNTDNTPGQMEAAASTAEGKKGNLVFITWDFGSSENEITSTSLNSREFRFMGFIDPPVFDFSNAVFIDYNA